MRARTGKIARLPATIRQELNQRLNHGALGRELVSWLNALPEVRRVVSERFANRPITEDNLSEWRRGGFQDWLLQEDRRERLRELSADRPNDDLEQNTHHLNSRIREQLSLELAEELERVSKMTDSAARFKCLQRLSQEMCRLHRDHLRNRELRLLETKTVHRIKPKSNPIQTRIGPIRALSDHGPIGGGGRP